MKTLLRLENGVLYWRRRTQDMPLPTRYKNTCQLFNSMYADQPITTDTFKCCGREYVTAEVIKELT